MNRGTDVGMQLECGDYVQESIQAADEPCPSDHLLRAYCEAVVHEAQSAGVPK